MALQESAERFDESRGVKFSTFAFRWVRFRMAAYAESCGLLIRVPQDLKPLLRKYRAIERNLQLRNEDSVIDEMQCKELWKTVRDNTDDEQFSILKEHYENEKAVGQIADEMGTKENEIRKKKNSALRQLRSVNKMRSYVEKIEEMDARIYNSGFRNYKEHDFTSKTEFAALRRAEIEAGYKRCLDEFIKTRDGPGILV